VVTFEFWQEALEARHGFFDEIQHSGRNP
jgi:hypothetical protein